MISHFHDPKDGYVYLEENDDWLSDGRKSPSRAPSNLEMFSTQGDIARIDESVSIFFPVSKRNERVLTPGASSSCLKSTDVNITP